MTHSLLVGLWLVSVGALCSPALQARASCASPPAEVVWSYPAEGAQDVPTDAVFWVLAVGSTPRASLEGRPLVQEPTGTFHAFTLAPGALVANKDYVLRLELPPPTGTQGSSKVVEIAFRTGSGPLAMKPAAPMLTTTSLKVEEVTAATCPEIVRAQDCFDTGQNGNLRFELAAEPDALGWLVRNRYEGASNVWPSKCGAPTIRMHAPPATLPVRGCFTVQAIGKGGALGPGTEHCPPQAATDAGSPAPTTDASAPAGATPTDSSVTPAPIPADPGAVPPGSTASDVPDAVDEGCSVPQGRPRSFPLSLLALLALLMWRRRRA